MPTYRVTGPDGKAYDVTAPEGASDADVLKFVQSQVKAAEPESTTNIPALAGESAVKGLTNLAGTPGFIADLTNNALDTILGPAYQAMVGRPIRAIKSAITGQAIPDRETKSRPNMASPAAMQSALTQAGVLGNPGAQPQTTGERYLSRAIEGAASAPFGISPMVAGAVGGMGAEAGGGAVPEKYKPLGELVGGILGGTAGAMGAGAVETAGRRLVTPLPNRLSPEEQRIANIATREGVRLTPGQATGNEGMQTLERSLAQLPGASGRQREIYNAQRARVNNAILNRAGLNADAATPDVLDAGFTRLGNRFDQLAAQTTVQIDRRLGNEVARVVQDYGRRLPTDIAPVFQSYVDDINTALQAAAQPGVTRVTIDGRTFQNIHSALGREIRSAAARRPELANALGGLQDAIGAAMERSGGRQLAQAWREARREYRNLLAIDKAMATGPAADQLSGNIPAGAFKNAVRAQDQRGFARGRGEMNDLARVNQFLADRIPDSGTARRNQAMGMLTGAGGAGVGGTAALMGASPATALTAAALSMLTPAAVQRLINNPAIRAYLMNQAIPQGAQGITAGSGAMLGALPPAERMAADLLAAGSQR